MAEMTPEEEALYALHWNVPRSELSMAAQLEYDRLRPAWERGEARPAAGQLEAARLAWERRHPPETHEPRDPRPVTRTGGDGPAVNGDEIRYVRFPRSAGYDASQVKDLLNRVAAELDAGRPAGPLIASAAFQRGYWPDYYYAGAVDWFLEQLRRREDQAELARMNADPWRDLATEDYSIRSTPFRPSQRVAAPSRQECKDAWRDFGQQPGTRLSWVRTGARRRELRTAGQQTVASLRNGRPTTLSAGGRTFTWKRAPSSSLPGIAETISRDRPGEAAHMIGQAPEKDPWLWQLLDETGTPILYHGYYWGAGDYIKFPGRRWLWFPVRGTKRANAIMTAVDQAGNKVARYRLVRNKIVEITVHPGQQLTDELALAIVLSAPWLSARFSSS